MRAMLPILASLAIGCTSALRGPDTCAEIHFDATYVLARWAGWSSSEALTIAAADAWTDQHPDTTSVATERRIFAGIVNPVTIPWVICSGTVDVIAEGETPARAYGRRVAEVTAWAIATTGHRLHFPAVGLWSPVLPAFYLNPVSGEIEFGNAEARRVLERAFLEFLSHGEDTEASLNLLGIGLHTLQDSIKHSGYTASQGHIGAGPNPDAACCNPGAAIFSAEVTMNSLRYARRLLIGSSSRPPEGWREALRRVFTMPLRPGEPPERRWALFVKAQFHDEPTGRGALLERWRSSGGEKAFARALVTVEETLR